LPIERPSARKCGVRIAEKIIVAALGDFPGIYHFSTYEATTKVAKFARSL
jgi:hypothetical protein